MEGTQYALGHFFGLSLRTQARVRLTATDQLHRRREHDLRALKRLEFQTLPLLIESLQQCSQRRVKFIRSPQPPLLADSL